MKSLGRYRLVAPLGTGAFATVWLAHDDKFELSVAIKVLADNWARDGEVRERFLNEARLMRRIASPRVVRVYDVDVADGQPYFVMDHLPGGTVADLMRTGLTVPEAIRLALDSAAAVDALHHAGVLHRDLKPSNLLLREGLPDPFVAVTDLGTAKLAADASGFTLAAGTPAYMAPELVLGTGGFDARADVYALGVLTYELLTGDKPLPMRTVLEVAERPPGQPDLSVAARLGLPAELDVLLRRTLSTDREDRPASAGDFADALRAAVSEQSASPATPPRSSPTSAPTQVIPRMQALPLHDQLPAPAPEHAQQQATVPEPAPRPRLSVTALVLLAILLFLISGVIGWFVSGLFG